jgi:hypothetical protein
MANGRLHRAFSEKSGIRFGARERDHVRDCDARTRSLTAAPARCPVSRCQGGGTRDKPSLPPARFSEPLPARIRSCIAGAAGRMSPRSIHIWGFGRPWGHVAEWLRNGLQNRVPRFNSGRGLQNLSSRTKGKSDHPQIVRRPFLSCRCARFRACRSRPDPDGLPRPISSVPRGGKCHLIAAMQQCIAVMQQASVIPLVYQNI